MTTLDPRPPYTDEEMKKLYPSDLKLKLVQVIFRHGERTPVSARFQDEGVPAYWPYCKSAAHFRAAVLGSSGFSQLAFRRRLEAHGRNGSPVLARGPDGSVDDICLLGELTDKGRVTTYNLGQRLRKLYGERLKFLPADLSDPSQFYFRSSPILRSLTSLQQVLLGLYPMHLNPASNLNTPLPEITILARTPDQENLFPNESNCRRFSRLARHFANLATQKWNNHPDMEYLNSRIGKYMPPDYSRVAVDGHPRLSGIMDTVNATLAHKDQPGGDKVQLPNEFYEPRVREIMNSVNVDEWYRGYMQSSEYRRLGIGSLLADFRDRMVWSAQGKGEGASSKAALKLALYGSHDTTVSAILTTLGVYDGKWPPFSSSIAIEMFEGPKGEVVPYYPLEKAEDSTAVGAWGWRKWFGGKEESAYNSDAKKFNGFYVRLQYNDVPLILPGCRPKGRHLEGDESLCTLAAFKAIVDKIAPKDWHKECLMNLDKQGTPEVEEAGGF